MPEGPKRAPGRYEVPVSKGAPIEECEHWAASKRERLVSTDKGNVILDIGRTQARLVGQTSKGRDAREDGISLTEVSNYRKKVIKKKLT